MSIHASDATVLRWIQSNEFAEALRLGLDAMHRRGDLTQSQVELSHACARRAESIVKTHLYERAENAFKLE